MIAKAGDRITKVTGWRYVWAYLNRPTLSWVTFILITVIVSIFRAVL